MENRSQMTAQSDFRADAPSSGTDFPCAGPAKGMSDYRRTPDAGPCAYVHRDSPQAPSSFGDRIFEGRVQLRLPDCAVRSGISRANISGPAVTLSPRSALNWSKSANTSASKRPRMEQTDSSKPLITWIRRENAASGPKGLQLGSSREYRFCEAFY